jgi:hypothetical protein
MPTATDTKAVIANRTSATRSIKTMLKMTIEKKAQHMPIYLDKKVLQRLSERESGSGTRRGR